MLLLNMNTLKCGCCNPPEEFVHRSSLSRHHKKRGFLAKPAGRPKKEFKAPRKSRAKPKPRPLERTPPNVANIVPSAHAFMHAIAKAFKHKMCAAERGERRQAWLDVLEFEPSAPTVFSDYSGIYEVEFEEPEH